VVIGGFSNSYINSISENLEKLEAGWAGRRDRRNRSTGMTAHHKA